MPHHLQFDAGPPSPPQRQQQTATQAREHRAGRDDDLPRNSPPIVGLGGTPKPTVENVLRDGDVGGRDSAGGGGGGGDSGDGATGHGDLHPTAAVLVADCQPIGR